MIKECPRLLKTALILSQYYTTDALIRINISQKIALPSVTTINRTWN